MYYETFARTCEIHHRARSPVTNEFLVYSTYISCVYLVRTDRTHSDKSRNLMTPIYNKMHTNATRQMFIYHAHMCRVNDIALCGRAARLLVFGAFLRIASRDRARIISVYSTSRRNNSFIYTRQSARSPLIISYVHDARDGVCVVFVCIYFFFLGQC